MIATKDTDGNGDRLLVESLLQECQRAVLLYRASDHGVMARYAYEQTVQTAVRKLDIRLRIKTTLPLLRALDTCRRLLYL